MASTIGRKDVSRLASYSGYVGRKVGRRRPRVLADRTRMGESGISRRIRSGDETVSSFRRAFLYGADFDEFEDQASFTPDASCDVEDVDPRIVGAQWKAVNACYVLFLTEAKAAGHAKAFETSDDWSSMEKQPRVIGKSVSAAGAAHESELVNPSEPQRWDESFVRAEVDEYADGNAFCWIEVTKGMRVRATIPFGDLDELGLSKGDEFLWSPTKRTVRLMSETKSESEERRELRRELEELSREFREELQDLDTGLDGE